MNDNHRIDALMQELGPLLQPEEIVAHEEECAWLIAMDEEIGIEVVHDDEQRRLVFHLHLSPVPEERQLEIYRMMLVYNYLWTETGGLRMALDSSGGATLLYEHPVLELDATSLKDVISNFAEQGRIWQAVIDREPESSVSGESPGGSPPPEIPPFGGIRA